MSNFRIIVATATALICSLFLANPSTAEETYFLLKSTQYQPHVDWDYRQGGSCQAKLSLPVNSHGEMELFARQEVDHSQCSNSVRIHYSFTSPPRVIRSGQAVQFHHSIRSVGKQGPNYYNYSGSIHGGCVHPTSRLIENVSINGGGADMLNNAPKSDEQSGTPVLFEGDGCPEGKNYVIAISFGIAGEHLFVYDVMKGAPPPIDVSDRNIETETTGQNSSQNNGQNSALPPNLGTVLPDGTVTDGNAVWKPVGTIRSATVSTLGGVQNGPNRPSVFNVPEPMVLVSVVTYHWNNGRGAAPGTIGVLHETGVVVGPWQANGTLGQGGVENAYWQVKPMIVLQPGQYTIIDSNPETWATNADVQGRGIFEVKLQKVEQIGSVLPTPDDGTDFEDTSRGTTMKPPKITIIPPAVEPKPPAVIGDTQSGTKKGQKSGMLPTRPKDPASPNQKSGTDVSEPANPPNSPIQGKTKKGFRWIYGTRGGQVAAAIDNSGPSPDYQGTWLIRRGTDGYAWAALSFGYPSKIFGSDVNGYELIEPISISSSDQQGWTTEFGMTDPLGDRIRLEMKFTSQNTADAVFRMFGERVEDKMERVQCSLDFASHYDNVPLAPVGCVWALVSGWLAEDAYLSGECEFATKCYIEIPTEMH